MKAILLILFVAAPWKLAAPNRITVEGDSTFHKWKLTSAAATATFSCDEDADDPVAALTARRHVGIALRLPIASLHSGEDALDENMRKALDAGHAPEIVFKSSSVAASAGAGGAYDLQVAGALTVHGTTRAIAFAARAAAHNGRAHVIGSLPIKMSDYGVTPPKFMGGMMKVADAVTVSFDVVVGK